MENLIEETINNLIEKSTKQKEQLLIDNLRIKGYGHLADRLKKRFIFPRVASIQQGEWQMFFVDNDEDIPDFIIAFKLNQPEYDPYKPFEYNYKIGYTWRVEYFPGEKDRIFSSAS